MSAPHPEPRVQTELVLASDGALYIALDPDFPAMKADYIGYALHPAEVALLGPELLLGWATTELLGLGSDGRIYVEENQIQHKRGRVVFRGFKATRAELARIVEEFHLSAMNLTGAPKARRRRKLHARRG